jgi:hypothetical protein
MTKTIFKSSAHNAEVEGSSPALATKITESLRSTPFCTGHIGGHVLGIIYAASARKGKMALSEYVL